jgi:hypothetical protein
MSAHGQFLPTAPGKIRHRRAQGDAFVHLA